MQTAVKTGTSSDYRDAWSVGYTNRYTVGVWMGNLDHGAMDGITGSKGPAMVLRSLFAELNRNCDTEPLYLSTRLVQTDLPDGEGSRDGHCSLYSEWFVPGTEPERLLRFRRFEVHLTASALRGPAALHGSQNSR